MRLLLKSRRQNLQEVGYVGRDVESIIKDLVEVSIRIVKRKRYETVKEQAAAMAEERILDILSNEKKKPDTKNNPFQMIFGAPSLPAAEKETEEQKQQRMTRREDWLIS